MAWMDLSNAFSGSQISARAFMGFSQVDDKLYIMGGDDSSSAQRRDILEDVFVVDLTQKTASDLMISRTPSARSGAGCTSAGDSFYIFGGVGEKTLSSGTNYQYFDDLYEYDVSARLWRSLSGGSQPTARRDSGFCSVAGRLFLFGGYTAQRVYMNDLHVFDLAAMAWTDLTGSVSGIPPSPRSSMAFEALGSKLYVFGGSVGWRSRVGDFFALDLSTMTWQNLGESVSGRSPGVRRFMSFAAAGDKLYLFGGEGNESPLNDLSVFDPAAMRWEELTDKISGAPPSARYKHGLVYGGGSLFVFGGKTLGGPHLNDLFRFDPVAMTWEDLSQSIQGTRHPSVESVALAMVGPRLYIFGGFTRGDETTSDLLYRHVNDFTIWQFSQQIQLQWHTTTTLGDLVLVYDFDQVVLQGRIDKKIELCTGVFPCDLSFSGSGTMIEIYREGSIWCNKASGCSYISLQSVQLTCHGTLKQPALHLSSGSMVQISKSNVSGCTSESGGGLLAVTSGSTAVLAESVFREMQSRGAGGVVLASDASVVIQSCEFRGCASVMGGGVVASTGSGSVEVRNSTFVACTSKGEGGCMLSLGVPSSVESSKFEGTHSEGGGGAISVRGSLAVVGSAFAGCSSFGAGGAIFARGLHETFGPQPASLSLVDSQWMNCKSQLDGGAIAIHGGECNLSSTSFVSNHAVGLGGALSVSEQGRLVASGSRFEENVADDRGGAFSVQAGAALLENVSLLANVARGGGGGGVYTKNVRAELRDLTARHNSAPNGGGGVLLWSGGEPTGMKDWPCVPCTSTESITSASASDQLPSQTSYALRYSEPASRQSPRNSAASNPGGNSCNSALYGACFASTFKPPLKVSGPSVAYAGEAFELVVAKKDFYGNTIKSDSSSILEASLALQGGEEAQPSSVRLDGSVVFFRQGIATFRISAHPSFLGWNASDGTTTLLQAPVLVVRGRDAQSESGGTSDMESEPWGVKLATSPVCETGAVLELRENSYGYEGSCKWCGPGTYSLNPLVGKGSELLPSCLSCPRNGICMGGSHVSFDLGSWVPRQGLYILLSCPDTHELYMLNAESQVFDHDVQQCRECAKSDYIVNGSLGHKCQPCPRGLHCQGDTKVIPVVKGSVWVARAGEYILEECPPGYRFFGSGDQQQCQPCGLGMECLEGSCSQCNKCAPGTFKDSAGPQPCSPCPEGTYNPNSGSKSSAECFKCPEGSALLATGLANLWDCLCREGSYAAAFADSTSGSFSCVPCPRTSRCSQGRPPVFATIVATGELAFGANPPSQDSAVTTLSDAFNVSAQLIDIAFSFPGEELRRTQLLTTVQFKVLASPSQAPALYKAVNLNPSSFAAAVSSAFAANPISSSVTATVQAVRPHNSGEVWAADANGIFRLRSCPSGSLLVNFSIADQWCDKCKPTTYSVDPTEGCSYGVCSLRECNACPAGARCVGGSSFELLVPDATWERETRLGRTLNRVARCSPGHVLVRLDELPQGDACVGCPSGMFLLTGASYATGQGVVARAEQVTSVCLPCPVGASCEGSNNITAKLGHWLLPAEEGGGAEVYRCSHEACDAGNTCTEGRDGVLCGLCKPGYAEVGVRCQKCSETVSVSRSRLHLLLGVLPVFLLLMYWISLRPMQEPMEQGHPATSPVGICMEALHQWMMNLYRRTVVTALKVLVSFVQVVTTYQTNFDLPWPSGLTTIWKWGGVISLHLFESMPVCILEGMAFPFRLKVYLVTVVCMALILAVPCSLLILSGRLHTAMYERVSIAYWSSLLMMLFLVYPTVSGASLQGWWCREIGGKWLIIANLEMPCLSVNDLEPFLWTLVATVTMPIGILLFMIWALFSFGVPDMARKRKEKEKRFLESVQTRWPSPTSMTPPAHVCGHCPPGSEQISLDRAQQMFVIACDGATSLSTSALERYLCRMGIRGEGEKNVELLVGTFDANNSGYLEFEEFLHMLRCLVHSSREGGEGLKGFESALGSVQERGVSWEEVRMGRREGASGVASALRGEKEQAIEINAGLPARASVDDDDQVGDEEEVGDLTRDEVFTLGYLRWSEEGATEEEKLTLRKIGVLFQGFKVQFWYFELVEMARKLTMTSLVIFLFDGTHKLAAALLAQCFFLILHIRCLPFAYPFLNHLQTACLVTQAVTIFYGLLMSLDKIQESVGTDSSSTSLELLSIMLHALIFLSLPFCLFWQHGALQAISHHFRNRFGCLGGDWSSDASTASWQLQQQRQLEEQARMNSAGNMNRCVSMGSQGESVIKQFAHAAAAHLISQDIRDSTASGKQKNYVNLNENHESAGNNGNAGTNAKRATQVTSVDGGCILPSSWMHRDTSRKSGIPYFPSADNVNLADDLNFDGSKSINDDVNSGGSLFILGVDPAAELYQRNAQFLEAREVNSRAVDLQPNEDVDLQPNDVNLSCGAALTVHEHHPQRSSSTNTNSASSQRGEGVAVEIRAQQDDLVLLPHDLGTL